MSEAVAIKTNLTANNIEGMMAAAAVLKMPTPARGKQRAYGRRGDVEDGLLIRPPHWRDYQSAVIDLKTGELMTDGNYVRQKDGQRGIDEFVQHSQVERNRLKFHNKGMTPQQVVHPDGTIELFVEIGGSSIDGGVLAPSAKPSHTLD